jgi:hypothetical protein
LKLNRRRRRVWVDGAEYETEKEAALAGVSVSSVFEALKTGGRVVKGHKISPQAPRKPKTEELKALSVKSFTPGDRKPLLRYPPGEGPMHVGLKRWS